MGKIIEITAEDGHALSAYRADPEGPPKGGLVVVQEIFGVNGHIRGVCDRFAAAGYAAMAPAVFDRVQRGVELDYTPAGLAEGRRLVAELDWDGPLLDIAAAAKALGDAGKVGVVGYCWGGTVAWLAATRLGLPAVGYYGGRTIGVVDETPKAPVMLIFGERDPHIPLADVEMIRAAHPDVPIHLYPAGHGFNCEARADYHAESAAAAEARTLAFFAEHLA